MTGDRRDVSRRDLLGGLLRRPLDGIRERLPGALSGLAPGGAAKPASSWQKRTTWPRRLRPPTHTVTAKPDAAGRFVVDLNAHPLEPGRSWRVRAEELAEPLILVRVAGTHHAASTAECPVDASDVQWHAENDVLWCPGCGSRWRLDGRVAQGPAAQDLLSLHVDVLDGIARIDVP